MNNVKFIVDKSNCFVLGNVEKTYFFSFEIRGEGTIERSHFVCGNSGQKEQNDYAIYDGVKGLGDECFSNSKVTGIAFVAKKEIKTIGNRCFEKSSITKLIFPESLSEIGLYNFPASLETLYLPASLEYIDGRNFRLCGSRLKLKLNENSKFLRIVDDVLYNYEMTEIIFCPRNKKGKFVIPESVTKIGHHCFAHCKELTKIIIPPAVKEIGISSFRDIELEKLVIPNSVEEIGISCFNSAKIGELVMSNKIVHIPNYAFCQAKINNLNLQPNIDHIGNFAFAETNIKGNINLISLQSFGENVFNKTSFDENAILYLPANDNIWACNMFNDKLKFKSIFILSLIPPCLNDNIIKGDFLDINKFFVPKGTAFVYKKAYGWSSIDNIEEFDISELANEFKDFRLVLATIYKSKLNFDRENINRTIENILSDFIKIESDEELKDAIQLIKYNRLFYPVLNSSLEENILMRCSFEFRKKLLLENLDLNINVHVPSNYLEHIPELNHNTNTIDNVCKNNQEDIKLIGIGTENVKVVFKNIQDSIIEHLNMAKSTITIAVSWFTNPCIYSALRSAVQNGVKVRMIINNDLINNGGRCLDFNKIIEDGADISLVEFPHLIHHKFCVIDSEIIINGSYNWTRLSEANYENVMICKQNTALASDFEKEFERLLQMSEHKHIQTMPEHVPEKPEYDRGAFRQYITEENTVNAADIVDDIEKLKTLRAVAKFNPEYFKTIEPKSEEKYSEQFDILDESDEIKKFAEEVMIREENRISESIQQEQTNSNIITQITEYPKDYSIANNIYLAIDASGSMKEFYANSDFTQIINQVLSVALSQSKRQKVALYTFNANSKFIKDVTFSNYNFVKSYNFEPAGKTLLNTFIEGVMNSLNQHDLVIIITDGDIQDLEKVKQNISNKKDIYWLVLGYGGKFETINKLNEFSNSSFISLSDFIPITKNNLTKILIEKYIKWRINSHEFALKTSPKYTI